MNETEQIMSRVLQKAPSAKMMVDDMRNLYIEVNGINLMEEHLFPPTKDPHRAWELAEMSMKITQNINRTHPLRTEIYTSNETSKRISGRKCKSINSKRGM